MTTIKKYGPVIMSLLLILSFVGASSSVFAEDADYQSNSGVGFYGEYEFPTNPPVEPPEKLPTVPNPGIVPPAGELLPQTGETSKNFFFIGSLLLMTAFGMGVNIKNHKIKGAIK